MLKYALNYKVLCTPKVWKFPAGEVGVRVLPHADTSRIENVTIYAAITSSDEVMQLLMLTDALKRKFINAEIFLRLGYTPYGRQDRVCEDGDSLSIAVFAALINAQGYASVVIHDPHSDVTSALFDRVEIITQDQVYNMCFGYLFGTINPDRILVAPDAGAAKKAAVIAGQGGFSDVLYASKSRNLATGEIVKLTLSGDVAGKDVVVIDDIADGGYTFIQLAKLLDEGGAKTKTLIVTHGIFSKGGKVLTDVYDAVYTTNTFHLDRVGVVDGITYKELM